MMGSLDLERRRPANPADDRGVKSDSGDSLRPLKRRRADNGEQASDLGEHSENATCRGEKKNVIIPLKISAQISQTEGENENVGTKNAIFEVEDSADDMQLESDSDAVQASDDRSRFPSPSTPTKRSLAASRGKIGIKHIDLLYEKQVQRLVCRMCLYVVLHPHLSSSRISIGLLSDRTRRKSGAATMVPVTTFPLDASWPHLIGHCEREHPAARNVLERMSPAQVVEMRQRGEVVRW
jgi:hypothetical protein